MHGLPGYQRFDSLAVEESGNICVATLVRGGISVFSPARRAARVSRGAGGLLHQHLFRRPRHAHGLHHAVRLWPALRGALAEAGSAPSLKAGRMSRVKHICTPGDYPATADAATKDDLNAFFAELFPGSDRPRIDTAHAGFAIAAQSPRLALHMLKMTRYIALEMAWSKRRDLMELAVQTVKIFIFAASPPTKLVRRMKGKRDQHGASRRLAVLANRILVRR